MGENVSLMNQNVLFGVRVNAYLCIRGSALNTTVKNKRPASLAGLVYKDGSIFCLIIVALDRGRTNANDAQTNGRDDGSPAWRPIWTIQIY